MDDVTIFQGLKIGCNTFHRKTCPIFIGIYCMAHRCNSAMQTFSNLPLVENIETLLQSMYVFFDSLFEKAHGTRKVGRNLVNKLSKDLLLCQNLVNLHAYTCQMGFGSVQNSCYEDA